MGMDGWSKALSPRAMTPEAVADLDRLVPASRGAIGPDRWQAVARAVATSLGAEAAVGPGAGDALTATGPPVHAATEESVLITRVAEQFVIDVAGLSDELRAELIRAVGAGDAFALLQVIWVLDWSMRADAAWRQLFGAEAAATVEVGHAIDGPSRPPDTELWPAMERFMATVARLDALEPLTTELVRLRGARTHNCRLCRSRRYVRAVAAGADEQTFDQIDDYEHSSLTDPQKVALRLVDALVWTPATYPPDLVAQVRAAFTPSQAVELVLDVVRNSANKIAVALGADQAQVAEGEVELYDVTADGEVIVGVTLS